MTLICGSFAEKQLMFENIYYTAVLNSCLKSSC